MLEVGDGLRLTMSGRGLEVSAEGDVVRAELAPASVVCAFGVGLGVPGLARRLAKALARNHLTLVVTRGGTPVVRLGSGVRSGFVGTLLGIPHLRLR